jgi:hypothetical protein
MVASIQMLKYAVKSGGVWTIETVDQMGNYNGQYSSIALAAPSRASDSR